MTGWKEKARLWADFNEIFRGNLLEVDLEFAMGPDDFRPLAGEWIRVFDGEGNECSGIIDQVDGEMLTVKLDLASWSSFHYEIVSEPTAMTMPRQLQLTFEPPQTRSGG